VLQLRDLSPVNEPPGNAIEVNPFAFFTDGGDNTHRRCHRAAEFALVDLIRCAATRTLFDRQLCSCPKVGKVVPDTLDTLVSQVAAPLDIEREVRGRPLAPTHTSQVIEHIPLITHHHIHHFA
tara:strand:- start:817 stop:1185 length:369 start_codon:yes stop_codon:yes gene_type:complete